MLHAAASSRPSRLAALRRATVVIVGLALAACGGIVDTPQTVPVVLTHPADQSVVSGSAATFAVDATGAAPLTYQWASSSDGTTFTPIAGATGSSHDTGATALAQSGTLYRVVVSNALGSATSSHAQLTVTPVVVAPAIVVQPADQSVTAPATATFTVTASGTAPSYQWQSSSDGGTTFAPVAGAADAPTLALLNTSPAQSGQRYRVRVSNGAGGVTSNAALLTVNGAPAAPSFTTQPSAQAIVAGAAATFTVVATGTPAPTLQWRIDGIAVSNGALGGGACAGAGVAGANSAALTLTNVPIGCSGAVFSVVAGNGVNPDAVSNGATLTVSAAAAAPIVTLQPADATVAAPVTATFTAAASGTPTPTVQWQQSLDAGATWANITGATASSFTTPATAPADSGKRFRAVFTNGSGSASSSAAVLTVASLPAVMLNLPEDVAFDAAGNTYIADTFNHTIRKVTTGGVVTTLAGLSGTSGGADGVGSAARFDTPRGLVLDAAGNLYVADTFNGTIRKITPAGVVSTLAGLAGSTGGTDGTGSAARFGGPTGLAIDPAGNLYVADPPIKTIRKVTPAGVVTTLAGLAGSIGSTDGTGSAARFNQPYALALDTAGNLYVADGGSNATLRKLSPAGVVTTLAGLAGSFGSADGSGSAARFGDPRGIAVDAADNIYVSDRSNHNIRKVTLAGDVTTLAGLALSPGNADGTGTAARFNRPLGLAIDAAGNIHVADSVNQAIRKITPAGVVTTVAQ
jgi:hypothetical protein